MQTKITLANQSQEINIIPQEGFEIDMENSDLKNGKVLFKEVEKIYPNKITDLNFTPLKPKAMSEKYGEKLEILDMLICLRDEYNRIDEIEEGFRFNKDNWCITNYNNKFYLSNLDSSSKIMHFGKKETAELFLKNFEKQLETVKEFL